MQFTKNSKNEYLSSAFYWLFKRKESDKPKIAENKQFCFIKMSSVKVQEKINGLVARLHQIYLHQGRHTWTILFLVSTETQKFKAKVSSYYFYAFFFFPFLFLLLKHHPELRYRLCPPKRELNKDNWTRTLKYL